jgi:hypothetical protein
MLPSDCMIPCTSSLTSLLTSVHLSLRKSVSELVTIVVPPSSNWIDGHRPEMFWTFPLTSTGVNGVGGGGGAGPPDAELCATV